MISHRKFKKKRETSIRKLIAYVKRKETFRFAFERMPIQLQRKILKRIKESNGKRYPVYKKQALDERPIDTALMGAFTWSDTPEGFNYWNNVYNKYCFKRR